MSGYVKAKLMTPTELISTMQTGQRKNHIKLINSNKPGVLKILSSYDKLYELSVSLLPGPSREILCPWSKYFLPFRCTTWSSRVLNVLYSTTPKI